MTTDPKCPFCGADTRDSGVFNSGKYTFYLCETRIMGSSTVRHPNCYETQLTQQAALLRECLEVVRFVSVDNPAISTGLRLQAAALIPKLEKYKEVEP